jgi:hypothetical protein
MRSTPRTRIFLTTVIAASLCLTAIAPGMAGATGGFGDVEHDAYYTDAVAWMVGEGITTGIETGCFGPTLDVSRGQVAAFLHRLDESTGNNPVSGAHPFVDVRAGYQQEPVGWLFDEGLTTGISPTRFAPNRSISRGDFAVLLWRYAGSPAAAAPLPFGDIARDYQRVAVAWMAERDITTGTGPFRFDPDGPVTRAQAATFLFRFVEPTEAPPFVATGTCTRDLRIALEIGGLATNEAKCAAPWLTDFQVDYLVDVLEDRAPASFELILAAATIGAECLTSDRVADLSRLFL